MTVPVPFVSQGTNTPYYGHTLYGGSAYGYYFGARPTQLVGWPEFYTAVVAYLSAANIVGPGQVYYAIDPDSDLKFPTGPSPFLLVVPGRKKNAGFDEGGGRLVKVWEVEIDIHIVVNSSVDIVFQDTYAVTSPNLTFGPYAIEHLVTDKFEQAYIVTASGNFATVEFPRHVNTGDLHRFKGTRDFVSIPLTFTMLVQQMLAGTLWSTALLPDHSDVVSGLPV